MSSNEISKARVAVASKGKVMFLMVKGVVVVKTRSSAITMASNRVVEARSAIMMASNRFVLASNIIVVVVTASNTVVVVEASNTVVVVAASNTVVVVTITSRVRRRKRVKNRMMTIQTLSLPSPI